MNRKTKEVVVGVWGATSIILTTITIFWMVGAGMCYGGVGVCGGVVSTAANGVLGLLGAISTLFVAIAGVAIFWDLSKELGSAVMKMLEE